MILLFKIDLQTALFDVADRNDVEVATIHDQLATFNDGSVTQKSTRQHKLKDKIL